MDEIIAKTTKGNKVVIKVNKDRIENENSWNLIISIPDQNVETPAYWGKMEKNEGLIFQINRNGKMESAMAVMDEIKKEDIEALKEAARIEIRAEQAPFVKSALIFSGSYLLDLHLGKVIKTEKYTSETAIYGAGQTIYQNAKCEERIDLQSIKDQPIINTIITRIKKNGETGVFYSGESVIYILDDDDIVELMETLKDAQEKKYRGKIRTGLERSDRRRSGKD